jgi:hypothetical protein
MRYTRDPPHKTLHLGREDNLNDKAQSIPGTQKYAINDRCMLSILPSDVGWVNRLLTIHNDVEEYHRVGRRENAQRPSRFHGPTLHAANCKTTCSA